MHGREAVVAAEKPFVVCEVRDGVLTSNRGFDNVEVAKIEARMCSARGLLYGVARRTDMPLDISKLLACFKDGVELPLPRPRLMTRRGVQQRWLARAWALTASLVILAALAFLFTRLM
jgi:hypothetical protein